MRDIQNRKLNQVIDYQIADRSTLLLHWFHAVANIKSLISIYHEFLP